MAAGVIDVTVSEFHFKRSSVPGALPDELLRGEPFVHLTDKFILFGDGVTPPANLPKISLKTEAELLALIRGQLELNALHFGAVPDGAIIENGKATGTDNAVVLQAYANWCRDNSRTFRLPNAGTGYYRISKTLTIYTDAEFGGTLLVPNQADAGNAVLVSRLDGDEVDIPLAQVKTWTGTKRRSRKIDGLNSYAGKYVTISTGDQDLIGRRGNPALTMAQGFLVTSNSGHLSSNLFGDWTNASWSSGVFKARTVRQKIKISGLKVVFYYDEAWVAQYPLHQPNTTYAVGARIREGITVWRCTKLHTSGATRNDNWVPASANCGVYVDRPNTDLYSISVDNVGGSYLPTGIYVYGSCGVRVFGWSVNNLYRLSDNYGFNCDLSHDIELHGGSCYNVRRAIDAHKSTSIRTFGGDFPDGVGAHYAWDMSFTNCNLGGVSGENPQVANIAGGNFSFINCDIYAHDQCSAAIRQRADIFELADAVHIEDCRITFAAGLQQTNTIFEIQGPSTGYDFGRDVEMPSNISIVGNTIQILDPTAVVRPVSMFTRWTAAQFPTNILAEGLIVIRRNRWIINGGVRPGGTGDPRIKIFYYKPDNYIGAGYDIYVDDIPGLWFEAMCNAAKATDTGMRARLSVSKCSGDMLLRYANGAFERYEWDRVGGTITQSVVSAGSAYVPIGDEYRGPTYPIYRNGPVAESSSAVRLPGLSVTTLLAQDANALSGAMFRVNNRNNRLAVADAGTWRFMDGSPVA